MQPDRHIPLQGASNFRDFGGYPAAQGRMVARGRLFRSDRLSDLTAQDYAALGAYRIRFVYDLRRGSELQSSPTRWAGEAAPELIHVPMFLDGTHQNVLQRAADLGEKRDADLARKIMRDMYFRMVTEPHALATLGRIFSRLAAPGAFPALFHCAAGKDRTGVTCALILASLGVSREDIVEDFMLTGKHYDALASLDRNIPQVVGATNAGEWPREALLPIFGVEPAYIDTALDQVEAEGGVEAFLQGKLGVSADVVERLRAQLLA
jgi:protein-tyrosine phosphatase